MAHGRNFSPRPPARWRTLFGPEVDRLEANVRITVQLCQALAYAHARKVLHRDVKPANVLLGEFGEVALIDWGVALQLGAARALGAPQLVGTPAYLAPEMVHGDEAALVADLTGAPRGRNKSTPSCRRPPARGACRWLRTLAGSSPSTGIS